MKKIVVLITVVIILVLAINKYLFQQYEYMKLFDISKVMSSQTLKVDSSSKGSYDVGLHSNTRFFYENKKHKGRYKLSIYNKKLLLEERIISTPISRIISSKSDSSQIVLNKIILPFKGYDRVNIKLEVIEVEPLLKSSNETIYLYVDPSKVSSFDWESSKKRNEKHKEQTRRIEFKIKNEYVENILLDLNDALKTSNKEAAKKILNDSNVSNYVDENRSLVHYAAFYNDFLTLKWLNENGWNIKKKDIYKKTPLQYAIENNATKTTKYLLKEGLDINEIEQVDNYLFSLNKRGKWSTMPPHFYSACSGLFELTTILLEAGANIDLESNAKSYYKFVFIYFKQETNYTEKDKVLKNKMREKRMLNLLLRYDVSKNKKSKGFQYDK